MRLKLFLVLALSSLCTLGLAVDMAPWDAAYDANSGTRFIPVELWTGSYWDGSRELRMDPADLTFGGGRKHIKGPFDYRPKEGDTPIKVYERTNMDKRQLFTLVSREDGTQGMGRVFDSRYDRFCSDEIKMPLGIWHKSESRTFEVHCGATTRRYELTIERLDYTCGFGLNHCLTFHWVVDGGIKIATDMHYTYGPGRGLLSEVGNER